MATVALNCALNVTENEEKLNKIGFLIEQIELLENDPHGRRYSPELITMCFMWLQSSTASYTQILNDGVFSLPIHQYASNEPLTPTQACFKLKL